MNQSGRMTATREALNDLPAPLPERLAALAEVEEWEAERDLLQRALNSMDSHAVRLMGEAVAEADRLKTAMEQILYQLDEPRFDHPTPLREAKTIARAALAPADRNTT